MPRIAQSLIRRISSTSSPRPYPWYAERGVHAPVAHHRSAGVERGAHDLGDVLGPVGGDDQELGAVVEVDDADVVEDLPQSPADVRPAGLPREDGAERVGEQGGLGALAASLRPFEGDVQRPRAGHGQRFFAALFLAGRLARAGRLLPPPFAATCSRRTASSSYARSGSISSTRSPLPIEALVSPSVT